MEYKGMEKGKSNLKIFALAIKTLVNQGLKFEL